MKALTLADAAGTTMSAIPYEVDSYRWTAETAHVLREGQIVDVDRMAVLLAHLPAAYAKALRIALHDTGLDRDGLSTACLFTVDQTLGPERWPG